MDALHYHHFLLTDKVGPSETSSSHSHTPLDPHYQCSQFTCLYNAGSALFKLAGAAPQVRPGQLVTDTGPGHC